MAAKSSKSKPAVSPERMEEIRASVRSGRGKSMFAGDLGRLFGPMCRCGVPRKPSGLAIHVADDGLCTVHPDKPAQPYQQGAQK